MSEATEADREKARGVLPGHQLCANWQCNCNLTKDGLRDAIAAALAEEREKTRAPFLALADDLDGDFEIHGFAVAEDIRRAAEDPS